MAKTKDALKIVDAMVGDDRELRQLIADEKMRAAVGRMVHDARTKGRLTHEALAELVGTKPSVIARLEDADYEGDSLRAYPVNPYDGRKPLPFWHPGGLIG